MKLFLKAATRPGLGVRLVGSAFSQVRTYAVTSASTSTCFTTSVFRQRRWCSAPTTDDLFAAVDDKTFKEFRSTQTTLVREDGRKVVIIPMQHVASEAFYREVVDVVSANSCYLVLLEGVLGSKEQLQEEQQLSMQLAQHAHMRQTIQDQLDDGTFHSEEEERALLEKTMVPYDHAKSLGLVHQELFFKPRLMVNCPLKCMNADVLQEQISKIEDADERNFFILHARTEHVGKVLRAYLDEPLQDYPDAPGADTIAVCWGASHCKMLEEDLLTRGFSVTDKIDRTYGWDESLYNKVSQQFRLSGGDLHSVL